MLPAPGVRPNREDRHVPTKSRRPVASNPDEKVSQVSKESPPKKVMYDWEHIAATLRADPGEWYKIFDRDRVSVANAIRMNGIKAVLVSDGFEVQTANNDKAARMCTLYLRYVKPKRGRK